MCNQAVKYLKIEMMRKIQKKNLRASKRREIFNTEILSYRCVNRRKDREKNRREKRGQKRVKFSSSTQVSLIVETCICVCKVEKE